MWYISAVDASPFPYQGPLAAEQVRGRDELVLDLLERVSERRVTALIGPRRYGKASVLARGPGAAGLLRTKLQHHFQTIGLLFAGSQPSLMRTLFTERTEPFYAQADLVPIGPLPATAVEAIVGDGFGATGRDSGTLAASIQTF